MKRIVFGVPDEDYEVIEAEAKRRGLKSHQIARSALIGDVKRSLNRSKSLDDVMERRFLKWVRENRDLVLGAIGLEGISPCTPVGGQMRSDPLPHLRRHVVGSMHNGRIARFQGRA